MSMVDDTLKVSATVCLATVTVGIGVFAYGGIKYGPGMAKSFNNAMDGMSRAAYAMESAFVTVDSVVEDLRVYGVQVAGYTRDTFGSISNAFEKVAETIEKINPNDYKKNTNKLLRGTANFLNATSKKAIDLDMKKVNDTITRAKKVIDDIIEEASQGAENGQNPGYIARILKWVARQITS